jgi:dTDP-4-amino-4,6-dideoxygalactose transaminase
MNVPLLDLKAQYQSIKAEMDAAVQDVFASQYFILGPQVTACEEAVAAYSQAAHGCGVSSGTDALLIALMNEGIGPGDEVITTPYTFFATAGSIARTGARPVFVDIDPETFNLRVDQVEERITPRTKAIMVVHLYGLMADMDAVMEIAQRHHLLVIEDAAQAIGSEYKGRRAGSIGDYGCFSFFPSKNLGGAGDGGMVVTQDAARAEKLIKMRNHGMHPKYYHQYVGGNFRLDALQAAVINVKLPHLDDWSRARQRNALRYHRLFEEAGLAAGPARLPWFPACTDPAYAGQCSCRHIFNQYVVRVEQRDALRAYLAEHQIGSEIYYPVPLHLQDCFADLGYRKGDFPEAERAAAETLALPIYPELTDEQAAAVVGAIRSFYH